jgi:two-component system, NtrC family, response regulator AtoC
VTKPTLLIIDDDEAYLNSLGRALRGAFEVRLARSPVEAFTLLSPPPDVVLLDLRLDEEVSGNQDGLILLQSLRHQFPNLPVLMISAYGDIETAVKCMQLGAVDFLQKPRADIREIKARLARAAEHHKLSRRITQLEQELQLIEPRRIVGNSRKIQEVKRVIEAVARDANVTVLIRGQTGTGKELVARAIHASGRRQAEPFVPVMLNAIPHSIIEPELFGFEAGAFTDARERRTGYLEKAHGGMLFLDEIGEVDMNVQVKLLRFFEEREFQRLGGRTPIKVDVQIVAATNANLEERVRDGRFREDLYFRLKVHEIVLPSLQQRAEDIPVTVEYLLETFHQRGKRLFHVAPEALDVLQHYNWPGNVRQLKNTLESAIFAAELHGHDRIELTDLPADILVVIGKGKPAEVRMANGGAFAIQEALARTELSYVEQTLGATHGKKDETWRRLGYNDRFALRRRIKRILELHPQLAGEFPLVKTSFAKDS